MTRRLEFTIIAGPNGAGKSKLGPFYSSVKAFDASLIENTVAKKMNINPREKSNGLKTTGDADGLK